MNVQVICILVTTLFTMVFFQNCGDTNEFSKNISSKAETSTNENEDVSQQNEQMITHIVARNCKRKNSKALHPNASIYLVISDNDLFPDNSVLINMDPKKRPGASYYSQEHVIQVDTFVVTSSNSQSQLQQDAANIKNNIKEAVGDLCQVEATNYSVNSNDRLDLTKNLSEKELVTLSQTNEISILNN